MKMKSYAMLAVSGFLALSLAHIAPVMAEDMSDTPSMQSNNDGINRQSQNDANNDASNNDVTQDYSYNKNPANNPYANPNANIGNDEDVSPDTATGDDDY